MVNAVRVAEIRSKSGSGGLWVGARPGRKDLRADLDELKRMQVDVVVCCMPWTEMLRLGIPEYPAEAQSAGILFYHCPIKDCTAPAPQALARLIPLLCDHLLEGLNVFVHCKAGLGRSASLCAACLLHFGFEPKDAIENLRRVRPGAIPMRCQARSIEAYHALLVAT